MADKHFIYILQLSPAYRQEENWTEETNDIISLHFNYLKNLVGEGKLLLAGKTAYHIDHPKNRGIVILSVDDEDSAYEIMLSDPAVKNNVMTAELHPFSLALLKEQ
jgi:uncharacterized protein YciI